MASVAVMNAVETRLASYWTHTPIVGSNPTNGMIPADNSARLYVQYPLADELPISIGAPGSNVFRERGGFRFVLAIPTGIGETNTKVWIGRLDTLRAAFRGTTFDNIRTYGATPPIDDGTTDDGAYYLMSFAVTYDYDVFG